jgi:hypothetical protein
VDLSTNESTVRDSMTPHRRDKPGGSLLKSHDRAP